MCIATSLKNTGVGVSMHTYAKQFILVLFIVLFVLQL